MKTHLIVLAGGKQRDTVMMMLPFWLRHLGDEGTLEFVAPIEDSIVATCHQTFWTGMRGEPGDGAIARLRTAINRLANKTDIFDAQWLFNYDALCLRRELPLVGPDNVDATWIIDGNRAYRGAGYCRGPIGFGRNAIKMLAHKFKEFDDNIEHGHADRALSYLVSACIGTVKMKQHIYSYAQDKIERQHHAEMAEKIRCGAYLLSGVRDAVTLAKALDAQEERTVLLKKELNDQIKEESRTARDAYYEGRWAERESQEQL